MGVRMNSTGDDYSPIKEILYALPRVPKELAVKYAKIPGIHVRANDNCKGCGICIKREFCKIHAINILDGKAVIDDRRCRGCTRCVQMCPHNGLEMYGRTANILDTTKKHVEPVINKMMDDFDKL